MQQVTNIHSVEKQISISGVVVYGRQKGREIGFPTANINADAGWLESGVYGVYVSLNGTQYQGVMNIGVKPTYGSTLKKTIEVHILEFHGDIYGESVECELLFKIREEQKFSSIERLKQQIIEDIQYAHQRFKHHEDFIEKNSELSRKEIGLISQIYSYLSW